MNCWDTVGARYVSGCRMSSVKPPTLPLNLFTANELHKAYPTAYELIYSTYSVSSYHRVQSIIFFIFIFANISRVNFLQFFLIIFWKSDRRSPAEFSFDQSEFCGIEAENYWNFIHERYSFHEKITCGRVIISEKIIIFRVSQETDQLLWNGFVEF